MQIDDLIAQAKPALKCPSFRDLVHAGQTGEPVFIELNGTTYVARVLMTVTESKLIAGYTSIEFQFADLLKAVDA